MALLRRAKITNIGITSDFGTWKTFPENVGKLLTIDIEINTIQNPIMSEDFNIYSSK